MDLVLIIALSLLMVPVAVLTSGPVRIALAVAFLVFFPGYTLAAALFPGKDSLAAVQRLALSVVLSVAMVPLIGMVLNYTPWGIVTAPLVGIISSLIIVFSGVALWRRSRLPPEERFAPRFRVALPHVGETRFDKILIAALVLAVAGAAGTMAYVIAVPSHVDKFSEFYLLSAEGTMEGYPREAIAGQPVELTVGITNREHDYATYVVEITIDGDLVSRTDPIRLANDRTWEGKLSFAHSQPGPDQRVEFLLYRNGGTEPYLTLHLMLDVREQS